MVIDTSALLAILLQERDAAPIAAAIDSAGRRLISAASVLEASIVLESRYGPQGVASLDRIIASAECDIVPFGAGDLETARFAFRHFGKGRHPAALNFGDCMVYALAAKEGEPVLCIGTDFLRTDIDVVSV